MPIFSLGLLWRRKTARQAFQTLHSIYICVILVSGTVQSALAETPSQLTIASEGARPPYNYFDGDHLAGFEIDLGRNLCARMNVTCTFVAQQWDGMIPGLLAHHYDAIMAAMEITPERAAKIAFTLPYIRMPSAFMVRRDSGFASDAPAVLAGKKIGVEKGGTHEVFLKTLYSGSKITLYTTLSDAILDLEAGTVDAVIGDKDEIVTFLQTRRDARCCQILADVPRDARFFGEGIGVGLRKEDTILKSRFEQALAACVADGTFAKLSAKYFSFPIN
jgi:polar amino acid transport system substrate-binding protein